MILGNAQRLALRKQKSDELRLLRLATRMSIKDFSKVAGISAFTISCIESGKRSWTVDTEIIYRFAINNYK